MSDVRDTFEKLLAQANAGVRDLTADMRERLGFPPRDPNKPVPLYCTQCGREYESDESEEA